MRKSFFGIKTYNSYNPLIVMLLASLEGVNYWYDCVLANVLSLIGGATLVDISVIQSSITSPLEGEVCFPIETKLKSGKQGEGYLSQWKVECGKWKTVLPLSNGEDAVVLALASYKCGEGVHPVGSKFGGKLCFQ